MENNILKIITYHSPIIETGTHFNNFGWQIYCQFIPQSIINQQNKNAHQWIIKISPKINLNDLGIPGNSLSIESTIRYIWGFGGGKYFYYLTNSSIFIAKSHNFSFAFNSYLTTDGTSQITGTIHYEHLSKDFFWGIEFENDVFIPFNDKYRTAGLEFKYGRKLPSSLFKTTSSNQTEWLTFSLGFLIWLGERVVKREQLNREVIIPLFYGKEYSHGILYLGLTWQDTQIAFGYDSEQLRVTFHNGFHFLINDGQTPVIPREDRWFLQVKFYDLGTLY